MSRVCLEDVRSYKASEEALIKNIVPEDKGTEVLNPPEFDDWPEPWLVDDLLSRRNFNDYLDINICSGRPVRVKFFPILQKLFVIITCWLEARSSIAVKKLVGSLGLQVGKEIVIMLSSWLGAPANPDALINCAPLHQVERP